MKSSRSAKTLAAAAHEAAVKEVMTAPKPGLVDAEGRGCHEDMDCAMFIKSAEAIAPFWEIQAEAGLSLLPPKEALAKLRAAGAEAELAMFRATGGINTHKGLIYLMSLLLYGAGFAAAAGGGAARAAEAASLVVRGSVASELASLASRPPDRPLSNGEKLFLAHGVTGIRGEAEGAFPSVTRHGLPVLRKSVASGASENDAGLAALLEIMAVCCDSNVIHRSGFDYWKNIYPPLVAEARRKFDPLRPDYRPLRELEKKFLPLRVSPGGAADLLSCTYFLYLFEKI